MSIFEGPIQIPGQGLGSAAELDFSGLQSPKGVGEFIGRALEGSTKEAVVEAEKAAKEREKKAEIEQKRKEEKEKELKNAQAGGGYDDMQRLKELAQLNPVAAELIRAQGAAKLLPDIDQELPEQSIA